MKPIQMSEASALALQILYQAELERRLLAEKEASTDDES